VKIQWPEAIDSEVFLRNYWQQKPLLMRQALTDFENPLDANELAGLSCDDDAQSRFIECQSNGEWRMCHGPFDEEFFASLDHPRWSLLVTDVEKLLPDFRDWLSPFRFLPDWRIDDLMISYAPVGGSVGAHVDQYDVFLLQADGQREWHIENRPRAAEQSENATGLSLLSDFSMDCSWTLQAGDMLYLPPGFAHHGIATGEPCMTWSIGFRAPSAAELLPALWSKFADTAQAGVRFGDPGRKPTQTPGCIEERDLQLLRDTVLSVLQRDPVELDRWIASALTSTDDRHTETDPQPAQGYAAGTCALIPNSQARFLYRQLSDDTVELYVANRAYRCSIDLARAICDDRLLGFEMQKNLASADNELVGQLVAIELLLPINSDINQV